MATITYQNLLRCFVSLRNDGTGKVAEAEFLDTMPCPVIKIWLTEKNPARTQMRFIRPCLKKCLILRIYQRSPCKWQSNFSFYRFSWDVHPFILIFYCGRGIAHKSLWMLIMLLEAQNICRIWPNGSSDCSTLHGWSRTRDIKLGPGALN